MNFPTEDASHFPWNGNLSPTQPPPVSSTPSPDRGGAQEDVHIRSSSLSAWPGDSIAGGTQEWKVWGGVEFARNAWCWNRPRSDSVESEATTNSKNSLSSAPTGSNEASSFGQLPSTGQINFDDLPNRLRLAPGAGGNAARDGSVTSNQSSSMSRANGDGSFASPTDVGTDDGGHCQPAYEMPNGDLRLQEQQPGRLRHLSGSISSGGCVELGTTDKCCTSTGLTTTMVTGNHTSRPDLYCSESDASFLSDDDIVKSGGCVTLPANNPNSSSSSSDGRQHPVSTPSNSSPSNLSDGDLFLPLRETPEAHVRTNAQDCPPSMTDATGRRTSLRFIVINSPITKAVINLKNTSFNEWNAHALSATIEEKGAGMPREDPLPEALAGREYALTSSGPSPPCKPGVEEADEEGKKENKGKEGRQALDRDLQDHLKKLKQKKHDANVRERDRIQRLSVAFEQLRRKLPRLRYTLKSVSKVEILRGATDYIRLLQGILGGDVMKKIPDAKSQAGALLTSTDGRPAHQVTSQIPVSSGTRYSSAPLEEVSVWPWSNVATSFHATASAGTSSFGESATGSSQGHWPSRHTQGAP